MRIDQSLDEVLLKKDQRFRVNQSDRLHLGKKRGQGAEDHCERLSEDPGTRDGC